MVNPDTPRQERRADTLLVRCLNLPWLPLLLVLVPVMADAALRSNHWPRWFEAILDESAHTATTLILFIGLMRLLRRPMPLSLVGALLIGGNLIDVDHVPSEFFDWTGFIAGAQRPYSHSMATLAILVCTALACRPPRRTFLLTIAFGVVTHLLRDAATGGISLLWPISMETVELKYSYYLALLCLVAVLGVLFSRGHRGHEHQSLISVPPGWKRPATEGLPFETGSNAATIALSRTQLCHCPMQSRSDAGDWSTMQVGIYTDTWACRPDE